MQKRILCACVALAVCAVMVPVSADPLAEAARTVTGAHKDAVITVRVTQKQKVSMEDFDTEESESVSEITGTIIQPSGLTVTSLSTADPSHLMQQMMAGYDEYPGFKMETELTRVTLLLADGKELEARMVLRDKDLDLAFLRPLKAPEGPLPFVDLTQPAAIQQFDPVIIPRRLGKVADRAHGATFARVEATIERPRTLHVLGLADVAMGAPAFTESGGCLGITVLRSIALPGGGDMFFDDEDMNMVIVVLPGPDVIEIAGQAPEEAVADQGENK